jgi:hypothetical protein
MYLRGEQLFERERPARERESSFARSQRRRREMQRNREKSGERKHFFFCSAPVCDGEKSRKAPEKHHPRCCPLCVYVCACELIKNLVVMINANYFFFFSGRAVCAANFIENQSDERRSARVLRGVTRPCPLCLSALSTLSRKMTLKPVDSIDWPFELAALRISAIIGRLFNKIKHKIMN